MDFSFTFERILDFKGFFIFCIAENFNQKKAQQEKLGIKKVEKFFLHEAGMEKVLLNKNIFLRLFFVQPICLSK